MPTEPTDRSIRVADLIAGHSIEDLRRAVLQSVDHAYKSAADVAEAWAMYEGALGTIAELKDENRRLKEAVIDRERQLDLIVSSRAWRSTQVVARPARVVRRGLHS